MTNVKDRCVNMPRWVSDEKKNDGQTKNSLSVVSVMHNALTTCRRQMVWGLVFGIFKHWIL